MSILFSNTGITAEDDERKEEAEEGDLGIAEEPAEPVGLSPSRHGDFGI